MSFTLLSPAKINLFLQILGKREDGFHELRSLMLPISLADGLYFELLDTPQIEVKCSNPSLPTDESNLVHKAAKLIQSRYAQGKGARIDLQKQIPIGAGLGGGSSNGSTTLVGLNRLWDLKLSDKILQQLAAEFGSDTAFFIQGRPALCEGRGEILTPINFSSSLPILLLNFGFGSSTAWAYKHLEIEHQKSNLKKVDLMKFFPDPSTNLDWNSILQNDLEQSVFRKFPILKIAKDFLLKQPQVLGAMMCGSGSTMMAILRCTNQNESIQQAIRQKFGASVWTWMGHSLPSSDLI